MSDQATTPSGRLPIRDPVAYNAVKRRNQARDRGVAHEGRLDREQLMRSREIALGFLSSKTLQKQYVSLEQVIKDGELLAKWVLSGKVDD